MNYKKIAFTPEQLLDIPCVDDVKDAPFEVPFFLLEKHKNQKEILLEMMEEMEPDKFREFIEKSGAEIKIEYFWKYKDSNVQCKGAHLVSGNIHDTNS